MSVSFPSEISGFKFWPLEFDNRARQLDSKQFDRLRGDIDKSRISDLLLLSHGWNNDEGEALDLYKAILRNVSRQATGRFSERRLAVAGVFWPSKKFADSDVIPGGAASIGGDVAEDELIRTIENLRGFFDAPNSEEILEELVKLVPKLDDKAAARQRFGELTQQALGDEWTPDKEVDEEVPEGLRTMPGEQLIDELSAPREEETFVSGRGEGGIAAIPTASVGGGSGSDGGSAFLGSVFSGIRSGARNALNLFTYFQMKDRAGVIGSSGVAPILRELEEVNDELKVHLVGHSFGGRLITASVKGGQSDGTFPAHSMTLLQAAFSHNGFARDYKPGKNGYFRKVTDSPGLPGPILVTHTSNDLPNRWAYPMASRLARHQAAAFGGPDDVFGAIGSNGARHTPEAEEGALRDTKGIYEFAGGKVYNLESSAHITGHSNVTGPEVAHALISAVVSVNP